MGVPNDVDFYFPFKVCAVLYVYNFSETQYASVKYVKIGFAKKMFFPGHEVVKWPSIPKTYFVIAIRLTVIEISD